MPILTSNLENAPRTEFKWDFGSEFAKDILEAIHYLSSTNMKRIDGDGFKAYWAGETLRIDIPREFTL